MKLFGVFVSEFQIFFTKMLLAMFVPAAVAAPVYQTEMSITPFQKNLVHEIENRSNLGAVLQFVNQLATYGLSGNLICLFCKWGVINCVTNLLPCIPGIINRPPSNVNKYDTLEAPLYILIADDLIMSNRSVTNVVPFNFIDVTPTTKDNTASVQWKHLTGPVSKAVPVTPMSDKHQQGDTVVRTQNPYLLSFPAHAIAPYFKFLWPMYSNYGNVFRPYSVSVRFDTSSFR